MLLNAKDVLWKGIIEDLFSDFLRFFYPNMYEYNSLDTSTIFRFKTYKIKGQDREALENSDNPFAIVVLAVLIALEKSEGRPAEVFNLSVDLARRLFRKGFSKVKITRLFHFLTSYVYFDNKEMFINFEREIAAFTNKEKPMGITELATQLIKEDGIEIGMQKTKVSMITNLLLKSDHSLAEIAGFAEVPIDFVIEVKNNLSVADR